MERKKYLVALFSFVLAITLVFFYCALPSSPEDNPANSKIALSSDLQSAAIAQKINFTLRLTLPKNIQSILVEIDNQTSKNFTSNGIDTIITFDHTFLTEGQKVIVATANLGSSLTKITRCTVFVAVPAKLSPDKTVKFSGVPEVGKPYSFSVAAIGTSPIKYSWYKNDMLIPNFDNATMVFADFKSSDTGTYYCIANNGFGADTSEKLVVRVGYINTKPKLTIDGLTSIAALSTCTLTVSVTDQDSGQVHQLSLIRSPKGSILSGSRFIWKPDTGFIGIDTVIFTVQDNGIPPLSDTQIVKITVGNLITNSKPLLHISGRRVILSSEACTLAVSATDSDSGQTNTISVLYGPSGYTFTSGKFIWKPTNNFTGIDSVMFFAVDNGVPALSDTQQVKISVNAEIQPPDSVKNIIGVSRISGIFTFKWNKTKDADSYVLYRSKDSVSFIPIDTVSDTIFANKIDDSMFIYYVKATNSTGQSAASQVVKSNSINVPPLWVNSNVSIFVNEGSSYSFKCSDSCSDANNDRISYTLLSGGPASDSLIGSLWKYAPGFSDSGSYIVKIKAFDGFDSSILDINLKVLNVNHNPIPQPQNLSTKRNATLQIILAALLPDGDPITKWIIDTLPKFGTAILSSSSQPMVTYTPNNNFIGADYFTFHAAVGNLQSLTSARIAIFVDTSSIVPVISQKISDKNLRKGDSLVLSVIVKADAFPVPLYMWYKNNIFIDSTRINTWKKMNIQLADSGFYHVIVVNEAGKDSSGAKISISNPPIIITGLAPTASLNQGTNTPLSVVINSDAVPTPTYKWYFGNTEIVGAITNSYSKSWTAGDAGTYKVVVSNIAGKDSSTAVISINLPPNAPTLVSPADAATREPVTQTIKWMKTTGATGYIYNISPNQNWTTPVIIDSTGTLTDTSREITGLSHNTTYYWRVLAKNAVGKGDWSSIRSFTTIPQQFTLTSTISPNGAGSITKTPNQNTYDAGTNVQLSAGTSAGYQFSSWGGDGTGTNLTVSITMNSNKNVTATFTPLTYRLVVVAGSNGSIVKPAAPDTAITVTHNVAATITAEASAGYKFLNWTVVSGTVTIDSVNSKNTTVRLTSGNAKVQANFQPLCQWTLLSQGLQSNKSVNCMSGNSSYIFVGTEDGIFRSANLGSFWTSANGGINATCLATSGNTVFAGSSTGLFRSLDNGSNWNLHKFQDTLVKAVVANGTNIFVGTYYGIFKSSDNGTNWTLKYAENNPVALTISNNTIFAGDWYFLIKSQDNGETWTDASMGITSLYVNCLHSNGNTIFAGMYWGGGVFRSLDGANWTEANTGITARYIFSLASNGTTAFAGSSAGGVYVSLNNGVDWIAANSGIPIEYLSIKAMWVAGGYIFAGNGAGVWRSALP
jgi:uncharacterized repeat protein (TIGR02543 family)